MATAHAELRISEHLTDSKRVCATSSHRWLVWFAVIAALLFTSTLATAQSSSSYLTAIGVPTFSTSVPVESGRIDVANGNLHLEIPLGGAFPQRGGSKFQASLVYDSAVWQVCCYVRSWVPTNMFYQQNGWRLVTSADTGIPNNSWSAQMCWSDAYQENMATEDDYKNFTWTAPDGTIHSFPIHTSIGVTNIDPTECPAGTTVSSGDAFATDGSGYHMFVTSQTNARVYAPDGTLVYAASSYGFHAPNDTNGNYYSTDATYNSRLQHDDPVDTLGRQLLSFSSSGSNDTITVLDAQGGTQSYTVVWETINVNTNFGVYTQYFGTISVIQEIDLPDGTKYQFSYDSGTSAGHYGLLTSMILPTGGTISYSYTNFTDAMGMIYRWISGRTTSGTGITGGTWSYTPAVISSCSSACTQQVKVTTPSGDDSVYSFNLSGGAWATQVQRYTGSSSSGTLLATTAQSYNYGTCPANVNCVDSSTTAYVVTGTETTTLPIPGGTNLNSSKRTSWDSSHNGNVTTIEEWNFYTGSLPPTADRTTTFAYLTGSNYTSRNIVNRPTSITVTNGSSATISQTLNSYDGSSLTSRTGRTGHDDTNYGTGMNYRGNLTQVQRLVTGSTYLTSSMTYDMLGNVLTSSDPNGNQIAYDYTDNFFDDTGNGSAPTTDNPSTPTNAYLKTATYPTVNSIAMTNSFGYYWGTGQIAKSIDPNSNATISHYYEFLNRPTSTSFPDGGWTLATYNYNSSSMQTQVDSYTEITSTSMSSCTGCRHDQAVADALGRPIVQNLVNDPAGQTSVSTSYDSSGRTYYVTNPYRGFSDPTYGADTFTAYDGLGRSLQVVRANGDYAYTYYGSSVGSGGGATSRLCSSSTYGLGYPILSVDEAGKKHQTWTDGFGRTIEADEPDSSNSMTVGTCNAYDLNNNLTQVVEGSQTRNFAYDDLSRLTSAAMPESNGGTTYYYYTTSGGGLCSGDPTEVCRRTDASSVTTT